MGGVRGSDVGGMDVRAWRVAVIIWATSRTTFLGNYGRFSGVWTEVRRCPALIYSAPVLVKETIALTGKTASDETAGSPALGLRWQILRGGVRCIEDREKAVKVVD